MAETVNMPKLGFDMAEGTLVRWLKKVGETINKGEVLAEIETDKATVEVESSATGVVRSLLVDEGTVVPINAPIAVVGTADEKLEEVVSKSEKTPAGQISKVESQSAVATDSKRASIPELPPPPMDGLIKASPLAKRIAREAKVDLSKIRGSGPGGRIVRRDIEKALSRQEPLVADQKFSAFQPADYSSSRLSDSLIPSTKFRQAIARRMTESKTSVPHFYVTHEYKMDSLLDLRRQYNAMLPENEKVSVNDFIVKAAALTLRQFANLNASLDGNSILRHGAVNIGVAVSVEGGLLTVVCKDADQKSLRQIAVEVKGMVGRARDGKVKPDDIDGSTFSVSNLGMYDVENFIAIINPPEAAILAIGSAREVAVVDGGMLKAGWRMKATLSVDHRVSDGVEAAKFMQTLAAYLEEPLRLLL